MNSRTGFTAQRLSATRKMVIASIGGNKKNCIHSLQELDVTKLKRLIKQHHSETGIKVSFTACLVKALALTLKEFPQFNSFIKGNRLIVLDEITISVLIERELDNIKVPEPAGIKNAGEATLLQIHEKIRAAQANNSGNLGGLEGMEWVRFIPSFLLRYFIKIADRNISLARKYGKVAITSVGMFSENPSWFIPHGSGTILLTVGGIKKVKDNNGEIQEKLLLTASFDHEIIDGAPAARFMNAFGNHITRLNFFP